MFSDQIPFLFSMSFLIAFTAPLYLIGQLAAKANIKNGKLLITGFYSLSLLAVSIASLNGLFEQIMLPPKIVLCTTLPLALFLVFIFNTKSCKKANKLLPLHNLVGVHIFRLIGSTFLILLMYDLLPKPFAIFAGTGDLITAISSVFVVKAIRNNKPYAKRLTYLWNTFGMVDIVITSAMAIIFTKISIDTNVMGVEFLAQFPFCFIPAFAPPTIIFLHLLVYRKLNSI